MDGWTRISFFVHPLAVGNEALEWSHKFTIQCNLNLNKFLINIDEGLNALIVLLALIFVGLASFRLIRTPDAQN